jgi:hypothetical protein
MHTNQINRGRIVPGRDDPGRISAIFEGNYLAAKGLGIKDASDLARVCQRSRGYKRIVRLAVEKRTRRKVAV